MSEIVISHAIELATQKVLALAFHPDGRRLAAGDRDGFIHIIDAETGEVLRTLGRHVEFVYALAFDPDTGHLISSGKDKSLRVWISTMARLSAMNRGYLWVRRLARSRRKGVARMCAAIR